MSSVPPVVDYKRMERLRPPENTVIPLNANTLCIFLIIATIIGLYKRHVDLNKPPGPEGLINRMNDIILDTLLWI